MASNGISMLTDDHWNNNPPKHEAFEVWLATKGKDAYKGFRKDHPTNKLSYEAWCQTEQVYGGYLFYATQMIWDEDDSSDDERAKRRRVARVSDHDLDPNRTVSTNGNGAPRIVGSATPTPVAISDEISASGKRKRKPRKKYMSQELVASDEEQEAQIETATAITEVATPVAPVGAINGLRKSGSRKPRKKPLSDEIISPEDEDDDPMELDVSMIASPLPVRPAPHTPAAVRQSHSPKKVTPKQSSIQMSRKSLLVRLPFHLWDAVNLEEKSEEAVLDMDTHNGDASDAEVSRPAVTPAAKPGSDAGADLEKDTRSDQAAETATVESGTAQEARDEETPDASASNTRRGLRNRKPAQRRPYYHDARLFEDSESDLESPVDSPAPISAPRRTVPVARAPKLSKKETELHDAALWNYLMEEAHKLYLKKQQNGEPSPPRRIRDVTPWSDEEPPKTKHFKGKGRAWKKEGSDEDEEFTPKQKKAAKAKADKAKAKAEKAAEKSVVDETPKQKKKIGRPRKSNLSEDTVRDESGDVSMQDAGVSAQTTPTQPIKRGRGRPRKSVLSSEIVRDDSDDEAPVPPPATGVVEPQTTIDLTSPPKTKPTSRPSTASSMNQTSTPKKRGRPRKSEISATPAKSSTAINDIQTSLPTSAPQQHNLLVAEPVVEPAHQAQAETPASAASAPTSTTLPVPTSTPTPMPMPYLNRGAALIESLYPRDPSRSVSASAPAPTPIQVSVEPSAEALHVQPQTHVQPQAEPQLQQDSQSQAQVQPHAQVQSPSQTQADSLPEPESQPESQPELQPEPQPQPQPQPQSLSKPSPKLSPAVLPADTPAADQDREMSASMSLSSDSEL